jgi:hypothetical protein
MSLDDNIPLLVFLPRNAIALIQRGEKLLGGVFPQGELKPLASTLLPGEHNNNAN